METLPARIEHLRQALNISQAELASKAGMSKQNMNNLIKDRTKSVSLEVALKMCCGTSFNPLWLKNGNAPMTRVGEELQTPENFYAASAAIPLVQILQPVEGGGMDEIQLPDLKAYATLPFWGKGIHAIKINGEKHGPRLRSGDILICKAMGAIHDISGGETILIKLKDGSLWVKEFLYLNQDEVAVGSINQAEPNMTMSTDSIKSVTRVMAIIPKGITTT